ncbi:FtsB family cell division protein [Desulfonatronovibrio hydrogenovorans]|uniref:FtsB family cell division protein n=1 Tax=Desulfonatronovibrio hydrogenovorans TaxID=53245 RepID=UPI00049035BE|nr:septum formation initiator family protein [Desulfonatronovibrio hydrogenovorans]
MLRFAIVLLLLLNAFMVHSLFWTDSGLFHLQEIRAVHEELERENQKLVEENKRLSREIMALRNDEEYILEAIRREMRYVKENEVIYFFSQDQTP